MMTEEDRALAEARARVVKALAHPTRMYLAARLEGREAAVGELTAEIGDDVSTVSKHLALLKQAGLVVDRKEAQRVLYSLRCPCIMEFVRCVDDVVAEGAERGLACVLSARKAKTAKEEK